MIALPEIVLLGMLCLTLLISLFLKSVPTIAYYCAQFTLVLVAALLTWIALTTSLAHPVFIFNHTFVLDHFSVVLKLFILILVFFTFLYSRQYNDMRQIPHNEFYVLGLASTLGMLILVSGHHLLTLFLGLELFSLPTYAMVALARENSLCSEAAMKYFVIGSVASGMLLYGLSMVFGATHSLDIGTISTALKLPNQHDLIVILGLVFIVAGVAFKLGAAPFHMWVPDVYEGAPSSVTLFIATAPKVAGFALSIRLLVDALIVLHVQWVQMLIVVTLLSMSIGNIAAIAQSNIKRMLAYSSIAHMGYMLLGVLTATPRGYTAAMVYMMSYSLMTLAAFGLLVLMSRAGLEVEHISDFTGLNSRNPWLAFMMLITMFSLAGVPPLIGFIAKVGVLEVLIQAHLVWLAVLALLFAIIGSYYYLRVVKVMYFEESKISTPFIYSTDLKFAISVTGLAVLFVGIFPGFLFALCRFAF